MIPFKSGMFVEGKDFCGRTSEIETLKTHILSNARICVQGERRIGKSSLIIETIRRTPKHRILYIDLLGVKSENDICRRIISGILSFERNDSFILKMMKTFASLRPSLSVDPITHQPSLGIATSAALPPQMIESTLDIVNELRNPVVVFDEFQDILNASSQSDATAILRSKIQSHTKTCYIFSGSVGNKMFEIFNSPDSPFFKSAVAIDVGPIEEKLFEHYIMDKFAIGKRTLGPDVIQAVFKVACNIPGDIQRLCYAIWEVSSYGETINEKHIPLALRNIYMMNERMYEILVPMLSGQQLICLKAIAELDGQTNINKGFVEATGIHSESSIRRAVNKLIEKRMVMKTGTTYKICDPFFGHWLKKRIGFHA